MEFSLFTLGTNPIPFIIITIYFAFLTLFIKIYADFLDKWNVSSNDSFGGEKLYNVWFLFIFFSFFLILSDSLVILQGSADKENFFNLAVKGLLVIQCTFFPLFLFYQYILKRIELRKS